MLKLFTGEGAKLSYKESSKLELKERLDNTFLKTVSAFSNTKGGTIIFGVNNKGDVVGLKKLDVICDKIEREIVDKIKPMPYFLSKINYKDRIIKLEIEKGRYGPCYYKNKLYIRRDAATIKAGNLFLAYSMSMHKNMWLEDFATYVKNYNFCYPDIILNKYQNYLSWLKFKTQCKEMFIASKLPY